MQGRIQQATLLTYLALHHRPPLGMDMRAVFLAIMLQWDGRELEAPSQRLRNARIALCAIGLDCWQRSGLPYDFPHVAERLREMQPNLGAVAITPDIMRVVIAYELDAG